MRGQSQYTEPVDPQKKIKNFAVYKQSLPTYSSMQAGPGLNSSCSMNAKHLVLTMSFLGLQCLNSKNIAVPSNERQETTTKKLNYEEKDFLTISTSRKKDTFDSLELACVEGAGYVLWLGFTFSLVRTRVHEICPFALTKAAATTQVNLEQLCAHSQVQSNCQKGCGGWFVFLKPLSVVNWFDQEAISFGHLFWSVLYLCLPHFKAI